ncbi:FAD/NAD(P)-binding oxidoreductase [Nguyenibacter sp. L1]|uniref:FAD/NAD(P)-dependent oxidoreductase n=1 Tax=Nguyenibacter sp. L1 TaxID=3049350 RepID=UPI002B4A497A|nr:FAD/NAD(P)-binding oxidoreductase [Nguyenibacter sp. L1]WRH86834.1 FAD/NAD(P)-binding oxidoreductase [Nguyenibacter sp. L1]
MDDRPVIVVGTGPAGTRAAQRLVRAGLRPIVLDESDRQGGQIYRRQPPGFTRPAARLYGTEAGKATALHRDFEALLPDIDYRPGTTAWGVSGDVLLASRGSAVSELSFSAVIIASGATDRIMPCPGWTIPGVFSLGGAQIALKAQACAIGARPVFMGTGPLLYLVAWQYLKAGVPPVAVLDTSSYADRLRGLRQMAARPRVLANGLRYLADLRRAGVMLRTAIRPERIEDDGGTVGGIAWRTVRGTLQRAACDAVGVGYGLRSESQLADLLKCDFAFDSVSAQWAPVIDGFGRTSNRQVYLAGDGAVLRGADGAEAAGTLAACALLLDRDHPVAAAEIAALQQRVAVMDRFRQGLGRAFPWPAHLAGALPDETIVCRCENITAGEIRHAAQALDAPDINRAKALVRPGMGRCQGRMCGLAAAEILAHARGVPAEQVGRIRTAAPVKPLPLDSRIVP